MNSLHTFNETPMNAVRLQATLAGVWPIVQFSHAKIWISAITALAPHLTTEEVLGAWPTVPPKKSEGDDRHAGWWSFITNLGYEVAAKSTPSTHGTRSCWCWLRPDGDIWLSHDGKSIWQAGALGVKTVSVLPSGNWVRLVSHDKVEAPVITVADVLVGGLRPILPTLFFSSLLVQGLGLLLPVFIMVVYDRVIDGRAQVGYLALLTGMGAVLLGEATLRRIRGKLLVSAGIRTETLWINRLVAQLIHLPAALVERAPLSSQLNRIRGVEIFRDMAVSPIVLGALDMPFVGLVLLVLYLVAGDLVMIPLLLVGAYLTLMLLALPWIKSTLQKQAQMGDQQQSLVLEASQHQLALRADGLTDVWMERISANSRQTMGVTAQSTFLQHFLEVISLLGSSIAGLLTLSTGVHMVEMGTLSAGGLIASMMLVWRMLAPLSLMCTALPRLVQMFQTAKQFAAFLNLQTETPPLAPPPPLQLPQNAPKGDITLTGLTLRYTREHAQVLSNLSAGIGAGQMAMVMGANGSGKSSLLKVIIGLYPLQGGHIRLDGIDTRQWDPEQLRRHIAYLPQQPDLFTDTIAVNLRLANPLATDEELWQALEQADAAETVRQLNRSIDEPLDNLEVPEIFAHQLNLARLYLHNAPIVLCDEVPATLLAQPAGRNYLDWILAQKGQRTVLVVGQYQALMDHADLGIGLKVEAAALVGPAREVFRQLQVAKGDNLLALPTGKGKKTKKDVSHAA